MIVVISKLVFSFGECWVMAAGNLKLTTDVTIQTYRKNESQATVQFDCGY